MMFALVLQYLSNDILIGGKLYYAYIISQEVPTLSGGTFVKLTGVVLHYQALTLSGVFLLHY